MNEGTLAGGAPARVDPDEFANNTDHLYVVWVQLAQCANQHVQEVHRFSIEPKRFTADEVLSAWRAVNVQVNKAMEHLAFVTENLRHQEAGIVAALEAAAEGNANQI